MTKAFYITAVELAQRGKDNIPDELLSAKHLIYSSPATLAFNSPGAQGFGVKRAGLAVPNSVMLLVAPACCGRNTTMLSAESGYGDRFFYLLLDDTDIVTGRHLTKIPKAVEEVRQSLDYTPSAVMICITCVDALLGTDMDRVCRKSSDRAGVPVVPCYMYALTREKRLPPMASVRKSVYSLLKPRKRKSDEVNILGYFSPLQEDCELYSLLKSAGVKTIRELSRCDTFEEYEKMSQANFSLVLNAGARYAAQQMEQELNIPFIELARVFQADKISTQYRLLGQAIGAELCDNSLLMFDLSLLVQVSLVLGVTQLGFFQGIGRIVATVHTHISCFDFHNFCYDFVKKVTVVGYDKYSTRVIQKIGFQPGNTLHIQMVGRLIQKKNVRAGKKQFTQSYAGFLAA